MRNILRNVWFYVEDIVRLVLFGVVVCAVIIFAAIVAEILGSPWWVLPICVVCGRLLGWSDSNA